MLHHAFLQITAPYSSALKQQHLWSEIVQSYSGKSRLYHNLAHLEYFLEALLPVRSEISDWPTVLFALFYHDIVYNATSKTNEQDSADLACERLAEIGYGQHEILICRDMILATKTHELSTNSDTNFFTDADLSVLGAPYDVYSDYARNVRKEYKIYPDLLYNPGRKKVLQHFLAMPRIFKTHYFYSELERHARRNIERELNLL